MTVYDFIAYCDGIEPLGSGSAEQPMGAAVDASVKRLVGHPDADYPLENIRELIKGLVYLSVIEDTDKYSTYYAILNVIIEHTGGGCKLMSGWSSKECKEAIATIKVCLNDGSGADSLLNMDNFCHERERARAACRLKRYGVEVRLVNREIELACQEQAFQKLDSLAKSLGGVLILTSLIRPLSVHAVHGRILNLYQCNTPTPSMMEQELPWGLVFYICQRHLFDDNDGSAGDAEYEEFIQLAKDISLAVYDCQKFGIWEDIFHRGKTIIEHVRTLINRHVLYTFPQCSPVFAHEWCSFIVSATKKDSRCGESLSKLLDEYLLLEYYCYCNSRKKEFVKTSLSEIERMLMRPLSNEIKKHIFCKSDELNRNYSAPSDYVNVNGWKYPLVLNGDDVLLYPSSLSAWNWYEALLLLIKGFDSNIISGFGHCIEDFISENLSKHNVASHTGTYKFDGICGEADILIEGKKLDMLIECKKKPLTGKSKNGSDVSAWIDLSDSLVASQLQCARTEYGVRKNGHLMLHDKKAGADYEYIWKDKFVDEENVSKHRHIERITLTLGSFGFMQDRLLVPRILEEMMDKNFYVEFAGYEETYGKRRQNEILAKYDRLNEHLEKLKYYNVMIGNRHPFFHCRFLNLEQLYYLISKSNGNDDFCEKASGKYVSLGSQDFWTEDVMLSLGEVGPSVSG